MTIDGVTEQTRGPKAHIGLADALGRLAQTDARFVLLFEHGTLQVEMYVPRGAGGEKADPQQPHTRDEIYVVAKGIGVFFDGDARRRCQAGDLIFAPAASEHRFEDFSDDFAVWVMFYGPDGGEAVEA